jgi:hypothetical protein
MMSPDVLRGVVLHFCFSLERDGNAASLGMPAT